MPVSEHQPAPLTDSEREQLDDLDLDSLDETALRLLRERIPLAVGILGEESR